VARGQIVDWRFVNDLDNDGTIIGCFVPVHGIGFGFSIDDVADPILANFLRTHPTLKRQINCAAGPSQALWVTFTQVGNRATDIRQ
jgi:hypothetical protein